MSYLKQDKFVEMQIIRVTSGLMFALILLKLTQ